MVQKPGGLIREARKIDKIGLFMKLFGWIIVFIAGVWFSVTVFRDYLEDFLASRPFIAYGGALIAVAIGFIIQYLGSRRMQKKATGSSGGGKYRT